MLGLDVEAPDSEALHPCTRCVQICPSKVRAASAHRPTCRHQERRSQRVETGERERIRCLPIPVVTAPQHAKMVSVLGHGQNVPVNQSINQSTNHPGPAHQSKSPFRAPAARDAARAMSWVLLPTSLPRCTTHGDEAAARILSCILQQGSLHRWNSGTYPPR